jgi:amino acid adenylation domain-containing protein
MSKAISSESLNSVAIVGMAGRFPGARNLRQFWENLRAGVESISFFSDEELDLEGADASLIAQPNFVKAKGVLDDVEMFDASFFGFSPREAEIIDPQHRLFLECAWDALEDAGYDSEVYRGLVGVFAGTSISTYLFNILTNREILGLVGPFQAMLGNDKDHLATRVSYKLNLRGPSIAVQSGCSTSLVAVHLACQSLLTYQCDMALSGGVSVLFPQKAGYFYEEGGIYSPDGHCRAYDENARGIVGGSGVGAVVLKRLDEAIADGDYIHGIIRGSAINNDGSLKAGYTAPSIEGQASVVARAQALAGVDPETVGYIEGHGTATPLGDPIEVSALTRVFRASTPNRGFCAIGSTKSNIGHLDAAAGIAGLIKTVLALKNKEIPPSLHFHRPNPLIDFPNSPFYVNRELTEWKANGTPRRAGVSSFGIGGTNAHVVLEEAPPVLTRSPDSQWHLLVLSARSDHALMIQTENMVNFLRENPGTSPADLCYTLQVGRKRFNHRRALVCRGIEDARSALQSPSSSRVVTAVRDSGNSPVIFMFPGQGSQYRDMGAGLYELDQPFRRHVDQCLRLIRPLIDIDFGSLLFAPRDNREARLELDDTLVAQPALFVIEYALARQWIEWGIRPQALIGHSLGEYVAACISGVFGLKDALMLIVERGRAMQRLPRGSMLAVQLSEDQLREMLPDSLSIAAVNGPKLCTVSGETAAVEALRGQLKLHGIVCSRLRTTHAFHSRMMNPIVDQFADFVGRFELSEPTVPFVSSVTGAWITKEQATDPLYWARQLREPVRFHEGARLLEVPRSVLLEVGPGRTLSSLVKLGSPPDDDRQVIPSLRQANDKCSDQQFILESLGRLWLAGVEMDWPTLNRGTGCRRIPLPTYPFEREKYWIAPGRTLLAASPEPLSGTIADTSGLDASCEQRQPTPSSDNRVGHPRPTHRRPDLTTAYVQPSNKVEQTIAQLWEAMLGVEMVGINDDFLGLGGHSLLATQMIAKVRQEFEIDLPLRTFFECPTVAGLACLATKQMADRNGHYLDTSPAIIQPDEAHQHEPFDLTDVQYSYWIGRSGVFELGEVATHTYMESEHQGVDLGRFELALRLLIERHGMLRAVVLPDGRQQILKDVPAYRLERLDLRGKDKEETVSELNAIRQQMSHQVLKADQWPIFEIRASLLDDNWVRFHFSFDALIGDALSMMILAREFTILYHDPDAQLGSLEISFRDYVVTDQALRDTDIYKRAQAYWWDRLSGLPPAPQLPLATSPGAVTHHHFGRRTARIPRSKWRRLRERTAKAGLTPSGVLLAAYSEILSRWCKSPRFTVNVTLFNRLPLHPQVNNIVGDFTSLVLVEVDSSIEDTFERRARRIQDQLWDDLDHRSVSGVQVLRELGRRRGGAGRVTMPIVFTSTLNLNDGEDDYTEDAEDYYPSEQSQYGISQTPQVWLDHQVQDRGHGLILNWDAVEALFPEGQLDDMFAAYHRFVERLADDEQAWSERLPQLLPARQLDLLAANVAQSPVSTKLLQHLFVSQALRAPEQIAVISDYKRLTYDELYKMSNHLGRQIRELGCRPNTLVGIVMDKGWEQVLAALGILMAGGAFLPASPTLPEERLSYLLRHGEVELVITQPWLDQTLDWPDGIRRICIESDMTAPLDAAALESVQKPDDLAYVIYTSGSTGFPKGVAISHQGAVNTVLDINKRFRVLPNDRVLAVSSLSFDLSIYDIFGLLAAGGTIVFPTHSPSPDPAHWLEIATKEKVTIWNSVPALMEILVRTAEAQGIHLPHTIRVVLLSGDWIPIGLPEKIRSCTSDVEVVSLGGATEASIWSILHEIELVDPAWKSIPYGRPMTNQRVHVLNYAFEPCPTWVPGQLYIEGTGLARGYWRDEEKTQASFIKHPVTGARLYRTGDLGRYLPDGNIEFLGREDLQVKIRGHRIELGEIEASLARHEMVREAAVVAVGETRGDKRLSAFVVLRDSHGATSSELRDYLSRKLPLYMVPSTITIFDALPLTPNGKVDRQALANTHSPNRGDEATFVAPMTAAEKALTDIWASVLKVDRIGVNDNFFELGGDSLMATMILGAIQKAFNVAVSVRQLLEEPTVAGMAAVIEETIIDELLESSSE